jgi:uncharacterized 2Fe-2S/4Fe-4S cluster protein (DUF4445 family)
MSETERARALDIARRIEHVALATRMEFQEIFVDACQLSKPAKRIGRGGDSQPARSSAVSQA